MAALTRPADLSANRRSVNASPPVDLTGRLVRTVTWHGNRKLVSEPMLVTLHSPLMRFQGRRVVALRRPSGEVLQAYESEIQVIEDETVRGDLC